MKDRLDIGERVEEYSIFRKNNLFLGKYINDEPLLSFGLNLMRNNGNFSTVQACMEYLMPDIYM